MAPKKTGIKKLKAQLSAYVKRAANGERVLITDRGTVVAELVPHQQSPQSLVDRTRALAEEGRCQLARGFPDHIPALGKWGRLPVKLSKATVQRWHDEDRDER